MPREFAVYPGGECEGRPGLKVTNGRDALCFVNDGEGPGHYWGPDDDAWITERRSEADQVVEDFKNGEAPNYPPQRYRAPSAGYRVMASGRKRYDART